MTYKIINSNQLVRIADNAYIPSDLGNTDYCEYLAWIDAGNEPIYEEPVVIDNSDSLRAAAYREESDPIFFKAQRGEATIDQWLAKIQEIKNRYPPLV